MHLRLKRHRLEGPLRHRQLQLGLEALCELADQQGRGHLRHFEPLELAEARAGVGLLGRRDGRSRAVDEAVGVRDETRHAAPRIHTLRGRPRRDRGEIALGGGHGGRDELPAALEPRQLLRHCCRLPFTRARRGVYGGNVRPRARGARTALGASCTRNQGRWVLGSPRAVGSLGQCGLVAGCMGSTSNGGACGGYGKRATLPVAAGRAGARGPQGSLY
eukprot:scaffold58122_cov67-Phaeocystis_antarctica.AAC.3